MKLPKGPIAATYGVAAEKCVGIAKADQDLCTAQHSAYFDSGAVTTSSRIEGVHLDSDQHAELGQALSAVIAGRLKRWTAKVLKVGESYLLAKSFVLIHRCGTDLHESSSDIWSSFSATFPQGGVARCNPVNGPYNFFDAEFVSSRAED